MKFGMRKPSLKRSFKARTTGRAKRAVKRALIPGYGRKGMVHQKPEKVNEELGLQAHHIQHLGSLQINPLQP